MFIGHFAPAFAARALTNEAPKLGTLFVAAQLVDIGFFLLLLSGIEQFRIEPGATAMNPFDFYHYPYTHSLLGTAGWALGFAFIVWLSLRNTVAATWAALVVMSHWLLDYVSHRPDLTLAGGDKLLGLGLWNYPVATIAAELALFAGAFWWYLRRTRGPSLPPLILAVVMILMQVLNWFGPQPVVVDSSLPVSGLLAFALLAGLAYWVGSTRHHCNESGLSSSSGRL